MSSCIINCEVMRLRPTCLYFNILYGIRGIQAKNRADDM